ncbi:MAG: hypothetical protein IPK97_04070 [Ahniella sp.]|nr:hypothetical protein [Ahniella sp.]
MLQPLCTGIMPGYRAGSRIQRGQVMATINIRVNSLAQLFDSLDPSPFREKALDRAAEAYLIESVGEHSSTEALQVVVHAPDNVAMHLGDLGAAIHGHFRALADGARRRQRARHRQARHALFFGLGGLALGLGLRTLALQWPGPASDFLAEGFLILAWVALWRPAEVVLYDRWERREELRVLDRLSTMPVELRLNSPGPGH